MQMHDELTTAKQARLLNTIQEYGSVAVAFSGGVDSALVAKAASLALPEATLLVTAVSPSLASGELELAKQLAEIIGVPHRVIATEEFETEGYQANAGNRCYYCKSELYSRLGDLAGELGVKVICNGANLDDQGDYRPGMKAAAEHNVRSPLIEAGFTKENVRTLAKAWGLEVWNKPAMPCLSSRIAYGVEVTPERVRRVDLAEKYLREMFGLSELRVRCEENDLARIEVPEDAITKLLVTENRRSVSEELKRLGFNYITIDLEGFRSGSMNKVLESVELQTKY